MVINRVHTSFIDFGSNGSKFKKNICYEILLLNADRVIFLGLYFKRRLINANTSKLTVVLAKYNCKIHTCKYINLFALF